jgi:Asp-tRNA(Asn)/Glu-tRNA(Gln) amidotransferase A subunit family amidase
VSGGSSSGSGVVPIGLQIVGRSFDEATVLSVAHSCEQATGGAVAPLDCQ